MKNKSVTTNAFTTLIGLFFATVLCAQIPTNGIDVIHYNFNIFLNDSNDIIKGNSEIFTQFTRDKKEVIFDFVNKNSAGKGMTVTSVSKNNIAVNFSQDSQHLFINDPVFKGTKNTYHISYEGIPTDGLIITKNKFYNRTFFSDNWPNRAHNWIPCNDHPSDKATVDFIVTAPEYYQVISNGEKIEETNLPHHFKLTHWKENVPLPTKIMVIGVAKFAVNNIGNIDCIPVSSWVFPEDKDSGFKSYAIAKNILPWFINNVGSYAFEKLANVQSKTIFGGMENASCIFYFENSVHSKTIESLFVHEIAHQWFGDHVTEKDWPHLWLSEGFATYMTDLFFESKYGIDTLKSLLKAQRKQVLHFSKGQETPVVDTTKKENLMDLLNPNSYQKGAWVLHMLRRKLGDSLFWKGIRTYYRAYAGSNANTNDLQNIFEKVSQTDLHQFFNQWLYTAGQPILKIDWSYDQIKKSVLLKIEQTQKNPFEFPLKIQFREGNKVLVRTIELKTKITEKKILLPIRPTEIIPDPNVDLLFRANVKYQQ
ncbi:MAG: M1 family metallopeptidase [Ginsengibacter sp.]